MELVIALVEKIPVFPILFGILFLFYWLQVFFIIYHLVRFGIGPAPKLMALIFFTGAALLVGITFIAYSRIDFAGLFENLRTDISDFVPDPYNLSQ